MTIPSTSSSIVVLNSSASSLAGVTSVKAWPGCPHNWAGCLARANTGDMKWKKFLYRQFCSREGIYVCPAPSCGECKDHAKCFGPEN